MKLLDRYVLSIFLPALGMFTLSFVFLFLAVDFASKLGKFLHVKTIPVLPFILQYYGARLPMMLTYLLPTVFLFAPMFTVIKLARNNEILPVAASGTSLRRMSLPFLLAALLAGAAIAAMDEYVLSNVGDQINDTEAVLHMGGEKHGIEDYDGYYKIWAVKYIASQKEMVEQVRITRLDEGSKPVEIVSARRCFWDSSRKRWIAVDGWIEYPEQLIHKEGQKPVVKKEPIPAEGYVVRGSFKPEALQKSSFITTLPFGKLRQLREDAKKYPHVPSMWMKVYGRFSFPLSPLVLLLMGLPFVVAAHSKSFIKGLLFCFLLALGFYLTHFACMDLGNRGSLPPLGAAFGPTALFGLFGLISFARMRT